MNQPTDRMMAALLAAEHIVSISPVLPTEVKVTSPGTLAIYFHRSVENVEAFGRHFDAYVTSRPHMNEDDTKSYTSADCEVNGVSVRAWTLTQNPEIEKLRARIAELEAAQAVSA